MPLTSSWPIDHIGIAVPDLSASIAWYEETTGAVVSHRETLHDQGVELVFLDLPNTRIELLSSKVKGSALDRFITKRGPGLHHICYRVDNVVAELDVLHQRGIKLIDITPRRGAHGSLIAFIHPSSCHGVLTELCEFPVV